MLLTKYEPFHLLDKFFNNDVEVDTFQPRANIIEDKKSYRIEVELPGIDKKDVNLEIKDEHLIVTGERKKESEKKEDGYSRYEVSYGAFTRIWKLGRDVDSNNINAESKNGVLIIILTKTQEGIEKDKVKRIEVK